MDSLVAYVSDLEPIWIYVSVGILAFIENIFPPFPSDVLVVAAGSFSAGNKVDPYLTVAIATIGSTSGFTVMFLIGEWFGRRILDTGKIGFLAPEHITKVEDWFRRYGYAVIVVNRFLAGTRAVVSFLAGISDLRLLPCVMLSFFSALFWNIILIGSGYILGVNWRNITIYLQSYGEIMTSAIVVLLIGFFAYKRYRLYRQKKNDDSGNPE